MTVVGFHASHEQAHPAELLDAVRRAERVGFDAAMCSDHFAPWSRRQGHSGFAWSWLGAALATTSLPFGVVSAPGQRYHPAIIAQASATLAAMFPGRFWVALGSGEAVNEHITGDRWPPKPERQSAPPECVEVIRALHAGEEVTHPVWCRWIAPESGRSRRSAGAGGRSGVRRDRRLVRVVGRWPDHGRPAAGCPSPCRGCLPRRRGPGKTSPSRSTCPMPPTKPRPSRSPMTSGGTGRLGPPICWDTDSVEAFDAMTSSYGLRTCGCRAHLRRPCPARRVAGGAGRARVRCRPRPPRRGGPARLPRCLRREGPARVRSAS